MSHSSEHDAGFGALRRVGVEDAKLRYPGCRTCAAAADRLGLGTLPSAIRNATTFADLNPIVRENAFSSGLAKRRGDYWRQAVFYKILVDHYSQKDWKVVSFKFEVIGFGKIGEKLSTLQEANVKVFLRLR